MRSLLLTYILGLFSYDFTSTMNYNSVLIPTKLLTLLILPF